MFNPRIGTLDLATSELIAVGVAVTTQCSYCIADYPKRAVKAGASKEQVAKRSWSQPSCARARVSRMAGRPCASIAETD